LMRNAWGLNTEHVKPRGLLGATSICGFLLVQQHWWCCAVVMNSQP